MSKRILLLAMCAAALCACTGTHPEGAGITVYTIVNENGFDRLSPQWHPVADSAGGDELISIAALALTSPDVQGTANLSTPPGAVPAGIAMSVRRGGSVVELDFGPGMNSLAAPRQSMIMAAAVLTLLGIEGVGYVYVTIDGQPAAPFYDRAITASGFITEQAADTLLH